MTTPMDPAIVALAEIAAAKNEPPLHEITPEAARERVRAGNRLCAGGPALHAVEDVLVPIGDGSIRARIYRPRAESTGRMLVYFHGGGWVTGDLDYADELCRYLARDSDCMVVSVDYRLAPEHPHPHPFTDAYTALCWAAETVDTNGILAVGGDSSGGNLAAACALHSRDNHGPAIAFQLLIYPVADNDFQRSSYIDQAEGFPIGAAAMRWFFDHYIPDVGMRAHPAVAPLRAADLSGLPPAHVVVAGHDPLHDEGVAYADRLRAAGVRVSLRDYPTMVHGFFRLTGAVPAARTALRELTDVAAGLFDDRHSPSFLPGVTPNRNNHAYH